MSDKLDVVEDRLRSALATLDAAQARVQELEAALGRFAEVHWADDLPDNFGITIAIRTSKKKTSLKVADFRRAAAAMRKGG